MSTTAQKSKPGTGVIGPVRFSYLYVHEARLNNLKPNDPPKFEATLLVPKEPNEFCPYPEAVLRAVKKLVKEAADDFFGEKKPADPRHPVRDGDEPNRNGEPRFPGYWYVKTTANFQPLLIDGYRNKVTDREAWVSGDWGFVKVACFGYDNSGNQGVSVGLRGVQFVRKDVPFGTGGTSPDEFDMVEGDAPTTVAGAYDPFAED